MKTSTWLLVFFISMNVFAGALGALGVDAHLGLDPEVGGDTEFDQAAEQAREINAQGGGEETLFSAYNTLANGVQGVIFTVLPASELLANAGVPNPIVGWLFAAVPVIVGLDYAGFFRGTFLS
jgi:hypothetical protein